MIRNRTDTIVIKPRMSPVFKGLLIVVPLLLLAAGTTGAFLLGQRAGSAELQRAQEELAELTNRHELLEARYERVRESMLELNGRFRIDASANTQLRQELAQSNSRIAELTAELKFYRSIISPQDGKHGVRVQEITVAATGQPGKYRYKLVLIQTLQQGKELAGTVRFSIRGESDGAPLVIEYPHEGQEKLEVRFKYFQSVTGTFDFPDEFVPIALRVDLAAKKGSKNNSSLIGEKWYPWVDIADAQPS
jgi:hypothetical protein